MPRIAARGPCARSQPADRRPRSGQRSRCVAKISTSHSLFHFSSPTLLQRFPRILSLFKPEQSLRWLPSPFTMFFLSAALPLLALSTAASSSQPHKRSYDTHSYYTIELPQSSTEEAAALAARSLGAELVERVGELDDHWIVRRAGGLSVRSMGQDPVESRFHARRALDVASVTRLEPRKRVKRVLTPEHMKLKRGPRSFKNWDMRDQGDPDAADPVEEDSRDTSELEYLQNQMGFKDPMLNQQWHIANPESKEWELNVTGLWTQGITGRNVSVVVVDDGLDHEHEDLLSLIHI